LQVGPSRKSLIPVATKRRDADDATVSNDRLRDRGQKDDVGRIVRKDPLEIVAVPGRDPFGRKGLCINVHSITSSARASREVGIATPIAFAVLRLSTSRKLVGCWIGRPLVLAPLRIRST